MSLVPPTDPRADARPFYQAVVDAIRGLQRPGKPTALCQVTSTALPPAADWPACVVLVTDIKIMAVSDGAAWIRQDTGAPI